MQNLQCLLNDEFTKKHQSIYIWSFYHNLILCQCLIIWLTGKTEIFEWVPEGKN